MLVVKHIYRLLTLWCTALLAGAILMAFVTICIFFYFCRDLPDYYQLTNYDPPTISRVYSSEGYLMSELAIEHRIFRKINEIPQVLINAFIAAEDQNYYQHPGFDVFSIARAAFQNLLNLASDRHPVGGSTITQQVVKNFLLTNERSISRKVKEAVLAYRINNAYTKDRILELYLNQIYLGNGSYGVTSAALSYFNKDIANITLEEAALLAALPKAPSLLDPTRNPQKVKPRRDWVIDRMEENNFINHDQAETAKNIPIQLTPRFEASFLDSGYYAESVRLELLEKYGHNQVYEEGLSIYTNLNKQLQEYADISLQEGLIEYDRRHGYNGLIKHISITPDNWQDTLNQVEIPLAIGKWKLAIVLDVSKNTASIGLKDGTKALIKIETSKWARKRLPKGYLGKEILSMTEVLNIGDVILVGETSDANLYTIQQIPDVNGALIVMEPKTGKVLAMSGGYSFRQSKYNRALQAYRQPGSAFKPIVFLTALEKGFTPTSPLKDEPITLSQGPGKPLWTPKNYEGRFLGDVTLRKALEKSRNLPAVSLITQIGAEAVGDVATSLGIYDKAPPAYYSMALGAAETTLLKLTAAYAIFASNGKFVEGKIIDQIQDRKGEIIYTSESRHCEGCGGMINGQRSSDYSSQPVISHNSREVVDPLINYQFVSMLQGVIERGTARKALKIGKTMAGKTGTSNESNDTWFMGFTPEIVVGVFVGYDNPKTLGPTEQGSSVALPIFIKFMERALKNIPNKDFTVPEGIEFINTDYDTGKFIEPGYNAPNIIKEPVKAADHLIEAKELIPHNHEIIEPTDEDKIN